MISKWKGICCRHLDCLGCCRWLLVGPTANERSTGAAGAEAKASVDRKVLYWYDPMYPQQKFDKPGKSPFMDMQMVPQYADSKGDSALFN
jgi:Cu(I)/Ag(I) efflux system membrane fusion protein